ncbi:hypothetical protein ACFOLD_12590 [Kocuria carniphila]|uniref:hypothetical protein n=1 Tax=Kocuria TaxID=57493 RepID=UPI001C1F712C|nr:MULTISPECIES: hypothetical protein [Kocuria]MCT1803349.1 hypothetical protein [Kocuria carniphila]
MIFILPRLRERAGSVSIDDDAAAPVLHGRAGTWGIGCASTIRPARPVMSRGGF